MSREPAAMVCRPPKPSIMRPTKGAATPEQSSPTDPPPTTQASGHPVSAEIGVARTASR
ncbi:hypothetical protein ACFSCV_06295 [Methylopila henanensis]|uniref:Uncharacterized protein n=1 Tax=Methylopila henanensis TaxID=873516 RepID=A0ABW4K6P4_9HYPH